MKKLTPPDPVWQKEDGKWFFADECWADEYGPYDTEEECRTALDHYCKSL